MKDLDELTQMVDEVSSMDGDRYEPLVAAHDELRQALSQTDGNTPAAGR